jgi:hypothetical protein
MAKAKASEPEEGHSWLEQYRLDDPDFEPVLDRLSTERRVLGHITDEDHMGRGPRNTTERLALELAEDPNSAVEFDEEGAVQDMLDTLVEAGLIEQRDDGTYALTELGFTELAN